MAEFGDDRIAQLRHIIGNWDKLLTGLRAYQASAAWSTNDTEDSTEEMIAMVEQWRERDLASIKAIEALRASKADSGE